MALRAFVLPSEVHALGAEPDIHLRSLTNHPPSPKSEFGFVLPVSKHYLGASGRVTPFAQSRIGEIWQEAHIFRSSAANLSACSQALTQLSALLLRAVDPLFERTSGPINGK